jgi:hypothetical protein
MPPSGLYRIPQHHLSGHGPPTKRPSFSSMDFADHEPAPAPAMDALTETAEEKALRKQEKKERKEKKKQKKQSLEAQATNELEKAAEAPAAEAPAAEAPAADSAFAPPIKNGRFGPRGPYKKREKGPDGTPTSAKKRKRESDVHVDAFTANDNKRGDGKSLLDPGFLDSLKKSMGDITTFPQHANTTEPPESPPKKNKLGRPPGQRAGADGVEAAKQKVGEGTVHGVLPKVRKPKTERARDSANLEKTFNMIRTPVPVPSIAATLLSGCYNTPVPVPPQSHHFVPGAMSEPQPKKSKAGRDNSHVLVAETPPSQMPRTPATTRQSAIPFSLTQATPSATIKPKKSKSPTVDISSPEVSNHAPASAPAKLAKAEKAIVGSQGSVNPLTSSQMSFTASNLMSYKQPLNDNPKPRPRGRAASVATSTTSSASSSTHMSIKDMFLRVGKPYTDPITSSQEVAAAAKKKKAVPPETHDETDLHSFTAAYKASQKTVNFTEETEYLAEYLDWASSSAAAGLLPCLNKATGCSTKNETILRLQKADPSNVLKLLLTNETETKAAEEAIVRCREAETFLTYSIAARVPVPIGRVEGVWKLYCPKYADAHVDKYAFGQRSLTISSIAGFRTRSSAYTARLSIPPRSLAYTVMAFEAPPHASFRTTVLHTAAEKYKLEIMFLGNGYLKLRVDLNLLLKGKSVEGKGKKAEGVWEFLGVNEKAVVWREEVDELEVEGRKLCAKYDGGVRK